MRLALAALLFAAPLACTQASHSASRTLVERQVNQRLDRQLHSTLNKLLATQTAQVDASMVGAGLITRR
jgi:hypothetical protein